jgi:hypothetical protein
MSRQTLGENDFPGNYSDENGRNDGTLKEEINSSKNIAIQKNIKYLPINIYLFANIVVLTLIPTMMAITRPTSVFGTISP